MSEMVTRWHLLRNRFTVVLCALIKNQIKKVCIVYLVFNGVVDNSIAGNEVSVDRIIGSND
jgi:hypothetical protein